MGTASSAPRWKYKTRVPVHLHEGEEAALAPHQDFIAKGEAANKGDVPLLVSRERSAVRACDMQLPGQLHSDETSMWLYASEAATPPPRRPPGTSDGDRDLFEASTAATTRVGSPASRLAPLSERHSQEGKGGRAPGCHPPPAPSAAKEPAVPASASAKAAHDLPPVPGHPPPPDGRKEPQRWPAMLEPLVRERQGAAAAGAIAPSPSGQPFSRSIWRHPSRGVERHDSKTSSCQSKRPHAYAESTRAPSSRGEGWFEFSPDDDDDDEDDSEPAGSPGAQLQVEEAAEKREEAALRAEEAAEKREEAVRPGRRLSLPGRRLSLAGERCRSSLVCSSVAPSLQWQRPENVLIFVDWDDTLLPTTWLSARPWFRAWQQDESGSKPPQPPPDDAELLAALDNSARAFLLAAASLGRVCCVTMAARPWQERSMRALLPRLAGAWAELDVEVAYAQEEHCRQAGGSPSWVPIADDPLEEAVALEELGVRKKKRTMRRLLRRHLRRNSWRNVLSFGDGAAEQNAAQELAFELGGAGGGPAEQGSSLVKVVKMVEDPDCATLCEEIQMLTACLPVVVSSVDDFNVTVDASEEGMMDTYHKLAHLAEAAAAPLEDPALLV